VFVDLAKVFHIAAPVRARPLDNRTAPRLPCPAMSGTDPAGETDRLLALVRDRYGDRLTAEELDAVRRGVDAIVEHARLLRAVRLRNADEPWPPPHAIGP
jgi:hypothetical protein